MSSTSYSVINDFKNIYVKCYDFFHSILIAKPWFVIFYDKFYDRIYMKFCNNYRATKLITIAHTYIHLIVKVAILK